MKKKILLVEDREGQQKLLSTEIESISDVAELLPVCDSLQDVIDTIINKQIIPDCAILDAQIFMESPTARPSSARADTRWGLEVVDRLILMGLQPGKILVLTAFKQTVEYGLRNLRSAGQLRIIEKPIQSDKFKGIIIELISQP